MGGTTGAIPVGAGLLSALFTLVAIKVVVNHALEMSTAAAHTAKEGTTMRIVKLVFASAMDTVHGLGVGSLASCLLTKDFTRSNDR